MVYEFVVLFLIVVTKNGISIYILINKKNIEKLVNNILGYFHHRQFFKVASCNPNACFFVHQ